MKKKTTEISINSSSGAEKVERIEKEKSNGKSKSATTSVKTERSAKGASALGDEVKKINAASSDGSAEKESKAAKARVEAALDKKQAQEKRKAEKKARAAKKQEERKKKLADKKAAAEKRAAEKKARAEKHAAERRAVIEKRKAEKEAKLRERARAKANRNNESYKRKKQKSERRKAEKGNRGERNKGYGGWIAAVVSLGVVTLALATTVTVGAVEMTKTRQATMAGQKGTIYELNGIMENVDNDLDRARISNSPVQQSRILTDLLVQTRLAELDLEKLPFDAETDRNVTSFINRTAAECERMLTKLRFGESLSKEDFAQLERLYQTNHAVRTELDSMVSKMSDKDLMAMMKEGVGNIKDAIERMEKSTLEENMKMLGDKMKGAGMERKPSESKREDKPRIEAAKAEELCMQYFGSYHIADFQCVGETVARGYEAYNVQGYDDRGNQLFAEVSQADGTLLRFDYYEDCTGETFDVHSAELIAEEFLETLGYDDMELVRLRSNGSTCDFTFVYEDDGVAYYPDEIRVKVCRTRGVVSGLDVTKFLKNHKDRDEVKVKLTLAEAYGKLHEGLQVDSAKLVVVDTVRGERTAYEMLCSYGEEKYFVFLDAVNGEEISIVNVKSIA